MIYFNSNCTEHIKNMRILPTFQTKMTKRPPAVCGFLRLHQLYTHSRALMANFHFNWFIMWWERRMQPKLIHLTQMWQKKPNYSKMPESQSIKHNESTSILLNSEVCQWHVFQFNTKSCSKTQLSYEYPWKNLSK